jgi:DUF917 family protein
LLLPRSHGPAGTVPRQRRAPPPPQMSTAAIAGVPITPAAIADEKGNALVMPSARGRADVERVLRAACDAMGGSVGLACCPMEGRRVQQVGGGGGGRGSHCAHPHLGSAAHA